MDRESNERARNEQADRSTISRRNMNAMECAAPMDMPHSIKKFGALVALRNQRPLHMAQQAPAPQCGTSPTRQVGLKHRTTFLPGPLQVDGALSHCSTTIPVWL